MTGRILRKTYKPAYILLERSLNLYEVKKTSVSWTPYVPKDSGLRREKILNTHTYEHMLSIIK